MTKFTFGDLRGEAYVATSINQSSCGERKPYQEFNIKKKVQDIGKHEKIV